MPLLLHVISEHKRRFQLNEATLLSLLQDNKIKKKAELMENAESQTWGRLFATKGGEVGREYACLSD